MITTYVMTNGVLYNVHWTIIEVCRIKWYNVNLGKDIQDIIYKNHSSGGSLANKA